jgi:metal-responsive CopG/Arc/MetJ family transcriptional regulator
MMGTTYDEKTEKVGITLPRSLLKQTDKTRGDVPRSTYIRRAIENYLIQGKIRRGES